MCMTHAALQLCSSHFVEQFGVAVQHLEQFHQRQRRLGLAVLVTRECVDAAAENLSGLARVQRQFFLRTLTMNAGSTIAAFTSLLNASIAAL